MRSEIKIKSVTRPRVRDIKSTHTSSVSSLPLNDKVHSFFSRFTFRHTYSLISFLLLIVILFGFGRVKVLAPIFLAPYEVQASNDEERAQLQKQLEEVEKEIAQYEQVLATTQKEKQTLQNKINELKKQADKLSLQIKQTNLNLEYLNIQIDETTASIAKTTEQINETKKNLAGLLQALSQLQQTSLVEILLGNQKLSDFFDYANALNSLQNKIQETLNELTNLQVTLNIQNEKLSADEEETKNLLAMQLLQKDNLAKTQKQQASLLEVTKGNETKYQQMLAASRQKAAEIRGRIYDLIGVKTKVTFGEALDIANWVSSRLNIRPAFLLAILTQESNLGQNVGTCNRPGDPPEKSWRVVMKPDSRDAFLQITKELGLDPNTTPISCPINNPAKGLIAGKNSWGGAMGPAQFMPRTWLAYKDKIAQVTGHNPPNPWDVRDSFVAAALYLANWGATKQTRDAEWKAAMIYFSGSTNPKYSFYGDSVMAIADQYAQDIAALQEVASNLK